MREDRTALIPAPQLDRTVAALEKQLASNPNDKPAVRNLLGILDMHVPENVDLGPYTKCQHMLRSGIGADFAFSELLQRDETIERYLQWQSLLDANGVPLKAAVAQLITGQLHEINQERAYCGLHLALFDQQSAISRICHDCFKVQILPTNLIDLMRLYIVLRDLDLPRDNTRKCMVELREDVPYPYKGYIYCQNEEEVKMCRDALQDSLDRYGISGILCAISHGCSEFGLKFPGFKYSPDGRHNEFKSPHWWDRAEKTFFAKARIPKQTQSSHNTHGITIKDVLGFQTWLVYAEIIGDETSRQIRDKPSGPGPQPFTSRVQAQAEMRREQLAELQSRLD